MKIYIVLRHAVDDQSVVTAAFAARAEAEATKEKLESDLVMYPLDWYVVEEVELETGAEK